MKAKGTYRVGRWEESTYIDLPPDKKMTKASIEYIFTGDIEGRAFVEYLMFYSYSNPADQHTSAATYVGLFYFDGTLNGVPGSFAMEDNGVFEDGAAKASLRISKGSGAGQLKNIRGSGSYLANREGCNIELEYTLD